MGIMWSVAYKFSCGNTRLRICHVQSGLQLLRHYYQLKCTEKERTSLFFITAIKTITAQYRRVVRRASTHQMLVAHYHNQYSTKHD